MYAGVLWDFISGGYEMYKYRMLMKISERLKKDHALVGVRIIGI